MTLTIDESNDVRPEPAMEQAGTPNEHDDHDAGEGGDQPLIRGVDTSAFRQRREQFPRHEHALD